MINKIVTNQILDQLILEKVMNESEERWKTGNALNNDVALQIVFELYTNKSRTLDYLIGEYGLQTVKGSALLYESNLINFKDNEIELSQKGYKVAKNFITNVSLKLKPYN